MPSADTRLLSSIEGVMVYPNMANVSANRQGHAGAVKGQASFKAALAAGETHVREEMRVYDVRPAQAELDIDVHGFTFANLTTALPQTPEVIFDADEAEIRRTYWPEIEALAKRTVRSDGRLPKYAFALATQKFVPEKSARENVEDPFGALAATYSRNAHADFSEVVFDSAHKMLTKRGISEAEAQTLDLMFVNAWKPFGQVVKDNPLAILDWTSVDPAADVHIHPRGKPTTKGAIYLSLVTHNPKHRWVYLPDQRDDEVWLFKQADSRAVNKEPASLAQYGFHQSWKLPNDPGNDNKTRRSIAVRLLLAYERSSTSASKL